MATDFSEKERAFIDGLKAETGHDREGWMLAIAHSGLIHRNDIIDWLRQQGFTFAHASWLERIHHNGGRLIYADGSAKRQPPVGRSTSTPAKPTISPVAAPKATAAPITGGPDGDIDALLAAAKAYRPLAQVVLRECLAVVPGADATAIAGHIVLGHDRPFAAILPCPRDVRLLLAFAPNQIPEGWEKARLPSTGVAKLSDLTHMIGLTDARQLTRPLLEFVLLSARNCRG